MLLADFFFFLTFALASHVVTFLGTYQFGMVPDSVHKFMGCKGGGEPSTEITMCSKNASDV